MPQRSRLTLAVAGLAAAALFALTALNEHPPLDIPPGPLAHAIAGSAPIAAALVAALTVLSPWRGYLTVLLLTPYWDAAQVAMPFGWIQILLQTAFLATLGAGWLLERRERRVGQPAAPRSVRRRLSVVLRQRRSIVIGAVAGLLLLAGLSTLASPDQSSSVQVLLHGILEPAGYGLLLVLHRPDRKRVAQLAVVLGVSVALGGAINLVQTVPVERTLHVMQAQRLLFARLTYFNVGLFGEMLAMAMPLLIGALALRRWLGLGRVATAAVLVALACSAAALYLTFSKSAYLSTAAGVLTLLLLLAQTWRRRAAIAGGALALSAAVVPWPAAVLAPIAPAAANLYQTAMVALVGQSRFQSWDPATLSGRGSLLERLWATEAAVRMALDHPILGIGLDRFKFEYITSYRPPQAQLALDSAHDFWPEIAAELGLPAMLLALVLFLGAVWAVWHTYRRPIDEPTRRLAAVVISSLVAWLVVASIFASDMYRPWRNMSSDFVMVGILVAMAVLLGSGRLGAQARPRVAPSAPPGVDD